MAFAIRNHVSTYQGYVGQAVSYKRGEGLSPEPGWIDLNIADVKKIDVKWRHIPWRGVNGTEGPGQVSIAAWAKIGASVGASNKAITPDADEGGFELFGDLTFASYDDSGKEIGGTQVYKDVYVDVTGLEEVTTGLANAKSHTEGTIRVPLTDVRSYYKDHGGLVCRINVRTKSGDLEPGSMNKDNNAPWTVQQGLAFLFSQLPGTPVIWPTSDIFATDYKDVLGSRCPEIIAEGDPAVEHLQRILDQLGLVPKYLPDGNYEVNRPGSGAPEYGEIMSEPGRIKTITEYQRDEKRAVTLARRPPLVQVFGKPVVRRITLTYVPVIQDEDGTFVQLKDIEHLWGYSLEKINAQILNHSSAPFLDVPFDDEAQRFKRIGLLQKWAYRGYLPAYLFAPQEGQTTEGVPAVLLSQLSRQQFTPMVDFAAYNSELKFLGIKATKDTENGIGDQEGYGVVQPLVRGQRIGQGTFKNFDALKSYFDQLEHDENIKLIELYNLVDDYTVTIEQAGKFLSNVETSFREASIPSEKFFFGDNLLGKVGKHLANKIRTWLFNEGEDLNKRLKFKLHADTEKVLQNLRIQIPLETLLSNVNRDTIEAANYVLQYGHMLEEVKKQIKESEEKLKTWQKEFEQFERIYKEVGRIKFERMNLPWGPIEGGAQLDRQTGLLLMSSGEPLCHADKPFILHGSSAKVVADGNVMVTCGYEVKDNVPGAITSVLFTIDPPEDANAPATAVVAGFNRPSPIKARCLKSPTMRMYQADRGTPMNAGECVREAAAKAVSILEEKPQTIGYTYILSGFHQAAVSGATSAVIHHYEPKSSPLATTTILVNNPGGRTFEGGRGAVFPPHRPTVQSGPSAREIVETANEGF